MKIITLSGLDGSGKSTQLSLLKTHLEKTGSRVGTFHAIEFSLANRVSRFLRRESVFKPGKDTANITSSPFAIFLREIFLFIDILRFRSFKKNLEQNGVDFLLSDRYFLDTIINIEYLGGSVPQWVSKYIPTPDIAFYLRIAPEAIMQRDRIPEQGKAYLQKKFNLFEIRKEKWHLTEIDANRDELSVADNIHAQLPRVTDTE